MNIYLHVETTIRELDSKLLLATLAASRGHEVIISDIEGIEKGIIRGMLAPGIYHTKSLTAVRSKIERHQSIIDKGNLITSIDEESGLAWHGYETFARTRFSEKTIKDASGVFGWGNEDVDTLKQVYPKYSYKIHRTGSPRVDLWKLKLAEYWGTPSETPNRPFLLVVSNMTYANSVMPFFNIISKEQQRGHYERNPGLFLENFKEASEKFRITGEFIEAIQHLAKNNNDYDIVLRPHQNENIEAWRVYLKGIPNVHVIRQGSISAWVKNAFAVMHNGCTTALEATVHGKPLVTYIPFKPRRDNELSNELGYRIQNKEELLQKVNALFNDKESNNKNSLNKILPPQVSKKLYIDDNELAAEKMIRVWESLADANPGLSKPSNWNMYKLILKFMKFNGFMGRLIRNLLKGKFSFKNENYKFNPLNSHDIYGRVSRLQKILGIEEKLDCKVISDRTVLIKRK
jgi:surface carbohydrate biosynthesis protein